MSELENIENVEDLETIPTGEVSGEVSGEVTEDNSAEIEAEQERLRREHEEYLNSFPDTTVFYRDLLVDGNIKKLGMATKDPHVADYYKILDNHFDESELTYIGTKECGTWYLKGYEKPDQSEDELIEQKIKEIDSQLEQYMDNKVHVEKDYKNIESCVSYFNSTDDEFRSNARAALRWRDDIYKVGREVRDKVLAGELDWHEIDMQYILDRVDPLEW